MENQPPLPTPPPYKLFNVSQIGLATFLGSPLPGMWMMSENFKRLGQKNKATNTLLLGIGLTVLCFALGFILPDNFPTMAISVPFLIAVIQIAKFQLTKPLAEHANNGGQIESWGKAIACGVIALVVIVAIIFGIAFALPE